MTPPDLRDLLEQAEWIRSLARRLVGSGDRAADVAQDAWVIALDRPPRAGSTIRLWLKAVVTHLASRSARAEQRRERRERRVARPESLPSAADLVERATTQRALVDEVLALDE